MPQKLKSDLPQLSAAPSPSTSETNHRRHSSAASYNARKFSHSQRRGPVADRILENSSRKGELKGLQDSLTQYFTPNDIRRFRTATNRLIEQPLEIVIDPSNSIRGKRTDSISSSKSGSSAISPKSPHRRDRLEDALSPYFKPNPNKRRLHREGEYLHLSKGDEPSADAQYDQKVKDVQIDGEENEIGNGESMDIEMDLSAHQQRPSSSRMATRSMEQNKPILKNRNLQKRTAVYMKKRENVAAIKSAQLIKRACKVGKSEVRKQVSMKTSQPVSSTLKSSNSSTSLKNSIKHYFRPMKTSTIIAPNTTSEPISNDIDFSAEIDDEDRKIFDEARQAVQKDLENANNALKIDATKVFPPKIQIYCYEINTWYSSPYPQEYACLPVLHICDSCLMYLSVPESHARKCKRIFPPGIEIYRDGQCSIFEVDGNLARVYCRNLCLLAKLFIDHKTLYFDVEPFLFYVLTLNDEFGCHFVGYFSKEKYSSQKYNLACIVTLPCYQGRGFGRLLIDFSYLLSRREGQIGSPERPLSELGKITYHSYWLSVIYEFFCKKYLTSNGGTVLCQQLSLEDISKVTGIAANDIAETLAENRLLSNKEQPPSLLLDEAAIRAHWEKSKNNKRRIWLDENKLRWIPKVYTPSKDFRLRSPTLSNPISSAANSPMKQKLGDDEHQSETMPPPNSVKKNKRKTTARRKIPIDQCEKAASDQGLNSLTPGKIGRKKLPAGKDNNVEESSNSPENSDGRKERATKRQKKSSCKETREKRTKRQEPSTDEDEERCSSEAPTRLGPSTSATVLNESGRTRSHKVRNSLPNKCVVSKSKKKLEEETSSEEGDEPPEGSEESGAEGTSHSRRRNVERGRKMARDRNMERTSDSNKSDEDSTTYSKSAKKRKIWRKRTNLEKQNTKSSFSKPSSSSSESYSKNSVASGLEKQRDGEGTVYGGTRTTASSSAKKSTKRSQLHHNNVHSSDEEEENDDDRSYCCSSTSPQPIGDRLPMMKSSIKEHALLINMGGEPDTVNMGGEPDDDVDEAENAITIGITKSYKAPPLISHQIEAEDEEAEEPPSNVENDHQQSPFDRQKRNKDDKGATPYHGSTVQIVERGVEGMAICEKTATDQLLKAPLIQHIGSQKSCSPSDTATVEMPELEQQEKEKHISPVVPSFGEDEEEAEARQIAMEDDAPPKLSPQDTKPASNEPPNSTTNCPVEDNIDNASSSFNQTAGESDHAPSASAAQTTTSMNDEQLHNNTSSSSLGITVGVENGTKKAQNEDATNNHNSFMSKRTETVGNSAALKESSEMDLRRTSSLSHSFAPFTSGSNATVSSNATTIISLNAEIQRPMELPQQAQQHHYANVNSQLSEHFSAFNDALYNPPQNYEMVQQKAQQQQQPQTLSAQQQKVSEKLAERSKKTKEKTAKSVPSEKNKANVSKQSSSSSVGPIVPSSQQSSTSAAFPPQQWLNQFNAQQMAQFAQQYYQQQHHYYGRQPHNQQQQQQNDLAASMSQQMGYAAAAAANQYNNFYSHAWQQAWQMQMSAAAAAGKFTPSGAAAGYPTTASYEEVFAMAGGGGAVMLNGGAIGAGGSASSSAAIGSHAAGDAVSAYLHPQSQHAAGWPPAGMGQFGQLRHAPNATALAPSSSTASQSSFYPLPPPPPI